jgi:hypothetical protein
MNLQEFRQKLDQLHGPVINHFRPLIESQFSESASGGTERPVVLLLEATSDPVGRHLVERFFPGHPDVSHLAEKTMGTNDGVYLCTALEARNACRVLAPVNATAMDGIRLCPGDHFTVFIAARGEQLLYHFPIPAPDRERPRLISEGIGWLCASRHIQCQVLDELMAHPDGQAHMMAGVLMALVQRSFSHIDGFVEMVRRKNRFCAIALLRLQVDNMLRLSAFDLVNDPDEVRDALLEDKPLSKIKGRDGRPLTDQNLKTELNKTYPWIELVYNQASGFVHFSGSHIFATVRAEVVTPIEGKLTTSSLLFEIRDPGPVWGDRDILQAVQIFKAATEGLVDLCSRWVRKIAPSEDAAG